MSKDMRPATDHNCIQGQRVCSHAAVVCARQHPHARTRTHTTKTYAPICTAHSYMGPPTVQTVEEPLRMRGGEEREFRMPTKTVSRARHSSRAQDRYESVLSRASMCRCAVSLGIVLLFRECVFSLGAPPLPLSFPPSLGLSILPFLLLLAVRAATMTAGSKTTRTISQPQSSRIKCGKLLSRATTNF